MDGFSELIDLLILGCGFYALYAGWVLQKKGEIIKTFLVFKDINVNKCKDIEGYAQIMAPKLYTLGGVIVAYGVVALLNAYVLDINGLFLVMMVIFVLVLIWYGMEVKKAADKYF